MIVTQTSRPAAPCQSVGSDQSLAVALLTKRDVVGVLASCKFAMLMSDISIQYLRKGHTGSLFKFLLGREKNKN